MGSVCCGDGAEAGQGATCASGSGGGGGIASRGPNHLNRIAGVLAEASGDTSLTATWTPYHSTSAPEAGASGSGSGGVASHLAPEGKYRDQGQQTGDSLSNSTNSSGSNSNVMLAAKSPPHSSGGISPLAVSHGGTAATAGTTPSAKAAGATPTTVSSASTSWTEVVALSGGGGGAVAAAGRAEEERCRGSPSSSGGSGPILPQGANAAAATGAAANGMWRSRSPASGTDRHSPASAAAAARGYDNRLEKSVVSRDDGPHSSLVKLTMSTPDSSESSDSRRRPSSDATGMAPLPGIVFAESAVSAGASNESNPDLSALRGRGKAPADQRVTICTPPSSSVGYASTDSISSSSLTNPRVIDGLHHRVPLSRHWRSPAEQPTPNSEKFRGLGDVVAMDLVDDEFAAFVEQLPAVASPLERKNEQYRQQLLLHQQREHREREQQQKEWAAMQQQQQQQLQNFYQQQQRMLPTAIIANEDSNTDSGGSGEPPPNPLAETGVGVPASVSSASQSRFSVVQLSADDVTASSSSVTGGSRGVEDSGDSGDSAAAVWHHLFPSAAAGGAEVAQQQSLQNERQQRPGSVDVVPHRLLQFPDAPVLPNDAQ